MKKNLILISLFLAILQNISAQDLIKFWVEFDGKPGSTYSLGQPELFLTERAIDRREKYGIAIDSLDLPVSQQYLNQIADDGWTICYASKWLNAAVIETDSLLNHRELDELGFVTHYEIVYYETPDTAESAAKAIQSDDSALIYNYGLGMDQVDLHQGSALHNEGYDGTGKLIAIMDAGFGGVEDLPAFDSLWLNERIIDYWDFVDVDDDPFHGSYHGMHVLSIMGGNWPGNLVGTAPDAEYILYRTESTCSEYRIEEANWIAAAERADSLGADIIQTSLGYSTFNDTLMNYSYQDMDGKTALITRASEIAASKGIFLVASAGNRGNDPWKYITAPADAAHTLAVGAVDKSGQYVPFSSLGPTYDGRVKPDVVALGLFTSIQSSNGSIGTGSGTSYAAPVVAGLVASLWEKHPDRSNLELLNDIHKSSNFYPYSTPQTGYGIPNFSVASWLITGDFRQKIENSPLLVYPNPARDIIHIKLPEHLGSPINLKILNLLGRLYLHRVLTDSECEGVIRVHEIDHFSSGLYILQISVKDKIYTTKIVIED